MCRIKFLIVCYFFFTVIFASEYNNIENDVNVLTNNLLENLRVDPFLIGDLEFSESSRAYIDKRIADYANLVLGMEETEFSRTKRSLTEGDGNNTEQYFIDIKPYHRIPTRFPSDIVLFEQDSTLYAVSLESNNGKSNRNGEKISNMMSIKKMQGNTFLHVAQSDTRISNGISVAVFALNQTSTIIVAAENVTSYNIREFKEHRTNIYLFNSDEKLEVIQKINTSYASHVAIWEQGQSVYLSVAQFMKESSFEVSFEIDVPIYRWYGKHFDIVQFIGTSGARKILPFSVQDAHFLAVANSKANDGDVEVYSEIWKYNEETEEYEQFQRILTYACNDIKHFKIDVGNEEEHFLIVANSYQKDIHGFIKDNVPSIVYKFVDDYFIPFQSLQVDGIREWEPITSINGDVLLLATTIYDIKYFLYDGWHFVESKIQFKNEVTSRGIKAIHSYKFQNKTVIVIANEFDNETMSNVLEVDFSIKNKLKSYHEELLNWCTDNLNNIDMNYDFEILGKASRGDVTEDIDSASQEQENEEKDVAKSIQSYNQIISEVESKLDKSLQTRNEHIIDQNITAKQVIVNNDTILKSADIETINSIRIEPIFSNILNIKEGFNVDSTLHFDLLTTERPISPKSINNLPVKNFLYRNDFSTNDLVINGTVLFSDDVEIKEQINGITIDKNSILLKSSDQDLGNFNVENIEINNLETYFINNRNLNSTETISGNRVKITNITNLKVKNLQIGGYINEVDIPTLNKYALKKSGNQNISRTYSFDNIAVNNLTTNWLSGKKMPEDFVSISEGSYLINKDVKFTRDLSVNSLTALKYLDSIPVKGGKLDILLRDSTQRQYVSGIKSFENLELLDPIKLQGKIRSKDLDTMNPVVTIDSNLDLNGDRRITGDVIVEEIIKSNDIVTSDGVNSFHRVQQHALKLTDPEIPIHLKFFQDINVHEVFAGRINNIDPSTWLVNGAKQTQNVQGWKQFRGDLEITGDTSVSKINDIDIAELETNVLKKTGEQVISGKHYVKFIDAEKRITSNNIQFGQNPWGNVIMTTEDTVINGTTIFTNLASNATIARTLTVNGMINDLNISKIISDAVANNTQFKIFGHKTFNNITVDDMTVKNNFNIDNQVEFLEDNNLVMKGELNLFNQTVESFNFTDKCNGVDRKFFKLNKREGNRTHTITTDQEFESILAHGDVYIASNFINNVSLNDLENNTLKIDEEFTFESAIFNDIIVNDTIELDGHVENLDLDNIVKNNEDIEQNIIDRKTFSDYVQVTGNVYFNGSLNDFNVSDICGFSSSTEKKNLIIKGNAHFAKGPHVYKFNGLMVENMPKSVWFTDSPATINGNMEFRNNVTFKDNVKVQGLLSGINLNLLLSNYLSKTKDQKVSAKMYFTDGAVFQDDVATPEFFVKGEVNGINFKKFYQSVLLNDEQLFEGTLYLENCTINDLQGNYLVNSLDINKDIMRHDRSNVVTGHKKFKNLSTDNLKTDKNIKIQNIDILNWLLNGVQKNKSKSITGKKRFQNITFQKGLSLKGNLQGYKFDGETIMLKNLPQNVTGRKIFIRNTEEEIKFKALKVKGSVNNADIAELSHNQGKRNNDNIFKSQLSFHNNITVKNVVVEKLYQGVNVTELLKNISTLGALNNFTENYRSLLEMSTEIEHSLKGQAYFLDYFKPVTYIPDITQAFAFNSENEESKMMAFSFENGYLILNYYKWDDQLNIFVDAIGYSIKLGPYPDFCTKVTLGEKDYIYAETYQDVSAENKVGYRGELIYFSPKTGLEHLPLYTKGAIFVTSFEIEILKKHCLLLIYYDYKLSIKCFNSEGQFDEFQDINSEDSQMASVLNIEGVPYLVTISEGRENHDPRINVRKFNNETLQFEIHQRIYEEEPMSLTTITYNCDHYLAVAYGHLQKTMHLGKVSIRKFDNHTNKFTQWQNIDLNSPTHIEFAILPSQELVLYVLTENPIEPFNVYVYEGISGFRKRIVGSAIPMTLSMNQFSINNKHFVVTRHYQEVNIIQAIFKGEKLF